MIPIAIEGEGIISQRAQEVKDVFGPDVRDTINRLFSVMDGTGAMGFAAPQIHIPLRIFVFSSYPHINHEDAPHIDRTVVINPVIHSREEPGKTWEKCYSLPGIRGFVPRYRRIVVSYESTDGNHVENHTLEGFPAYLFEHEFDHLEGMLYRARVKPEDITTDIITDAEYKRRFDGDQQFK